MVKSIGGGGKWAVRCTEVVCFSQGPLLEVLLYTILVKIDSFYTWWCNHVLKAEGDQYAESGRCSAYFSVKCTPEVCILPVYSLWSFCQCPIFMVFGIMQEYRSRLLVLPDTSMCSTFSWICIASLEANNCCLLFCIPRYIQLVVIESHAYKCGFHGNVHKA